jgi:hypothetical protein
MDDLVFVDKVFDLNKTQEYNLSIQICLDGFSFSIHKHNQKCIALSKPFRWTNKSNGEILDLFKEQFRQQSLFSQKYNSIHLLWISKKYTIIPNDFFSETIAYEGFQLCYDLNDSDELKWETISNIDSTFVFSIPKDYLKVITNQFPSTKITHQVIPFINKTLQNHTASSHPSVYVNLEQDFFHIIVPDQNQKHFINSFCYQSETDFVYFILNIFKQQKLNNERSKLVLEGFIDPNENLIPLLKKYLNFVEILEIPREFKIKNCINAKEYNHYINLLNLSKCE